MIPQMHKPKGNHRWAWNLENRQAAYQDNLRWWLTNKRRFALRIVDGQAVDHLTIAREFSILDRLVVEAVDMCNVEDEYNERSPVPESAEAR